MIAQNVLSFVMWKSTPTIFIIDLGLANYFVKIALAVCFIVVKCFINLQILSTIIHVTTRGLFMNSKTLWATLPNFDEKGPSD